jgi:hypothetical protein
MKGSYAGPTDLMLHDRPFQITILIWTVCVLSIICYGKSIADWLQNLY